MKKQYAIAFTNTNPRLDQTTRYLKKKVSFQNAGTPRGSKVFYQGGSPVSAQNHKQR